METNDNKGQLKKLGKIEGVIYVESDNGSAPVSSQQGDLPLPDAGFPKKEPTQNINIPIPLSQHTRLQILKANRRQNIKQMVVEAIALWLDVQEGKCKVSAAT